eukprot:TRINITY_DN6432_c0_g1_i1.p1 TRINITY_DN6432_c0_g1~~TRINITY_DN6432_c0_g1_i1.p1  ORF type:complete len:317 (+),score=52.09 TRINITY_DN6432_c0_g1_i1:126-1076(+)
MSEGASSGISTTCTKTEPWEPHLLHHCSFKNFAKQLDVHTFTGKTWLVRRALWHMFETPLPPEWSEHLDVDGSKLYFFDGLTGESSWNHPWATLFKRWLDEVESWPEDSSPEEVFQRCDGYMQREQAAAATALNHWSGPYQVQDAACLNVPDSMDSEVFYFNGTTGESCWVDPRTSLEFMLLQQHDLVSKVLADHEQLSKRASSAFTPDGSDSNSDSDVAGDGSASYHDQPVSSYRIVCPAPRDHMGRPSLSLPLSRHSPLVNVTEASPRSCRSLLRAPQIPGGDDSVRSHISYCSAFSTFSEDFLGMGSPVGTVH